MKYVVALKKITQDGSRGGAVLPTHPPVLDLCS
jgi:hypothetical protein